MAEIIRLNKVLRELNISLDRAVDFLETKNIEIEKRPTTKITSEVYDLLAGEFQTDANKKVASKEVGEAKLKEKEALRIQREQEIEQKLQKAEAAKTVLKAKQVLQGPKKVGKIDLDGPKKLVDWKNPPDLLELKADYDEAQSSHTSHVLDVDSWLDALNGEQTINNKKGRSKIVPKLIRKQAEWRYAALSEPFLSTDDLFNTAPMTFEDKESAIQNGLLLNFESRS